MKQVFLFMVISLIAIVGCAAHKKASLNGMSSAIETKSENFELDAAMTDAEILAYFDLDINAVEMEQVQGKDGTQITYVSSEHRVSIVRSQVSGLSIVADGTNPAGVPNLIVAEWMVSRIRAENYVSRLSSPSRIRSSPNSKL